MSSAPCPHPVEDLDRSVKTFVWGMLTDWRLWVLAFLLGLLSGAIATALELTSVNPGAAIGGGVGVYAVTRFGRVGRCKQCGKIVRTPITQPVPGKAAAK